MLSVDLRELNFARRACEEFRGVAGRKRQENNQATGRRGDFRSLQSWVIVNTEIGALTKPQKQKMDDHIGLFIKTLRAVEPCTKVGTEPGLGTAGHGLLLTSRL